MPHISLGKPFTPRTGCVPGLVCPRPLSTTGAGFEPDFKIVGCVGCGICVKNCQHDAVKVENFHAIIDPEKCVGCGACMEKCPKKCIVKA